jgi:hypothetical protein
MSHGANLLSYFLLPARDMNRSRCLKTIFPVSDFSRLLRKILRVVLVYLRSSAKLIQGVLTADRPFAGLAISGAHARANHENVG